MEERKPVKKHNVLSILGSIVFYLMIASLLLLGIVFTMVDEDKSNSWIQILYSDVRKHGSGNK